MDLIFTILVIGWILVSLGQCALLFLPSKKNRKVLFQNQVNDAVVYAQIKNMIDGEKTHWNMKFEPKEYMGYYHQYIFPATNVSDNLKVAWMYQAKKSGKWIEEK